MPKVESAIVGLAKFHAFTSAAIPPDVLGHFRLCQYGHLEGMEEQLAERVLALPDADYFQKHRNTLRAFMHAHPSMRTDVHTRMGRLGDKSDQGKGYQMWIIEIRKPDQDKGSQWSNKIG